MKSIATAVVIFLAVAVGAAQQPARGMSDLTVPADRLPATCALAPSSSERVEGNRIRMGLWASLPIQTNPWAGTDPQVIATIYERVAQAPKVGDPVLTRSEGARFRLRLAEGIDEAYAAVYRSPESDSSAVVFGLRFADEERTREFLRNVRTALRIGTGPAVAVVSGAGPCLDAVTAYVRSLS